MSKGMELINMVRKDCPEYLDNLEAFAGEMRLIGRVETAALCATLIGGTVVWLLHIQKQNKGTTVKDE